MACLFVMLKIVLLALVAWLGLRPPDLVGLSTWYGPPAFRQGDVMRNGRPLDLAGPTVAVDASHWPTEGRPDCGGRGCYDDAAAVVLTECGTLHKVTVADTGRLYELGGWFRLGVRQGRLRYWPVRVETEAEPVLLSPVLEAETEWLEDRAWRVVADFPERFYRDAVACRPEKRGGDTQKVWVWILR